MRMTNTWAYDSIGALLDEAQSKRAPRNKHNDMTHDRLEASFCGLGDTGYVTLDHVVKTIASGWPVGLEKLQAAMETIQAPVLRVNRRRNVWADAGDEIEQQRVYAGQLDTAWRAPRRVASQGARTFRLVCQVSSPYYVEAEALYWRGAAVAKLAESLTEAGHHVQIEAYVYGTTKPDNSAPFTLSATVKPLRAPFSLSDAVATLACPAWYRGICFAALEKLSPHALNGSSGYYPWRLTAEACPSDELPNATTIICDDYMVEDQASAQAWVMQQIEGLIDPEGTAD